MTSPPAFFKNTLWTLSFQSQKISVLGNILPKLARSNYHYPSGLSQYPSGPWPFESSGGVPPKHPAGAAEPGRSCKWWHFSICSSSALQGCNKTPLMLISVIGVNRFFSTLFRPILSTSCILPHLFHILPYLTFFLIFACLHKYHLVPLHNLLRVTVVGMSPSHQWGISVILPASQYLT